MQAEQLIVIARQWFHCFNTKDLELLLSLYDDDAVHYSPRLKVRRPATNGMVTGKAALRAWWADAFERLPDLRYEPISFTANEDRVFMEYLRVAHGEPDMMVGEVLEVKAGKIVASRVYHS